MFRGSSMRVKGTSTANNNNSNNNNAYASNMNSWEGSQHSEMTSPRRKSPRKQRPQQNTQTDLKSGIFEIVSVMNANPISLVAMETGWKNDLKKLQEGIIEYAECVKPGVSGDLASNTVYAVKDKKGNWRRIKLISKCNDGFKVEVLETGEQLVVSSSDVLALSQLFRDWTVKSIDVLLNDYSSDNFDRLRDAIVGETLTLTYALQHTASICRDKGTLKDMKSNGENYLEKLVSEGIISKSSGHSRSHTPAQYSKQISNDSNSRSPSTQRPLQERPAVRNQRAITKSNYSGDSYREELPPRYQRNSGQGRQLGKGRLFNEALKGVKQDSEPKSWSGWTECNNNDRGSGGNEPHRNQRQDSQSGMHSWNGGESNVKDWSNQNENEDPHGTADWWPDNESVRNSTPKYNQHNENGTQWRNSNTTSATRENEEDVFNQVGAFEWKSADDGNLKDIAQQMVNIGQNQEDNLESQLGTLDISGTSSASIMSANCSRCVQLSNQVNELQGKLYTAALQNLIATRLRSISTELRQIKIRLAGISLDPASANNQASKEELTRLRNVAKNLVVESEALLQAASQQTLDMFGMSQWIEYVGTLWRPMMDLQFYEEKSLGVHNGTVIREIRISQDSSTIILERAIEVEKMFKLVQDLKDAKIAAKVNSVFFSEDNSKVFLVLEKPVAEVNLEVYAKQAIKYLRDNEILV